MITERKQIQCKYLYYCTLVIYISLLFVFQTELRTHLSPTAEQGLQLGRYLCYLLFLTKIVLEQVYRKKYLFAFSLGLVSAALCMFSSDNRGILFAMMTLVAGYNCSWKKVMKIFTTVFAVGLFVTIVLCRIHVFEDMILDEVRMRHNLGFNWVTLAPIYMLFICIGYANIRKNRSRLVLLGLWAISFILYKYTDTRLTFLLTSLFLLGILIQSKKEKKQWRIIRAFRKPMWLLPFAIFVVIMIAQKLYTPGVGIWDKLNSILSGRLLLAHNSLNDLPTTLFGQAIRWQGFSLSAGVLDDPNLLEYNNVDCSYIRLMFDYGVIGIFVIMTIYALGIKKAVKMKNFLLVWSYMIVLAFCITEQWMIELSFNMMPLIAIASLHDHYSKEYEQEEVYIVSCLPYILRMRKKAIADK